MRDMGSPVSSKDCNCLFTRLWSDCKIFKHEKYSRVHNILLLGKKKNYARHNLIKKIQDNIFKILHIEQRFYFY